METYLGPVLDVLPVMVWTARASGSVDFVNRRWSEFTGLRLGDGHGATWQSAINPDDLSSLLERWKLVVATGEAGEMEARVRRSDGQYRWFTFQCSPMRDGLQRITKWFVVGTDVDDLRRSDEIHRKSAEEALRISKNDLGLIINTFPVMAWSARPDGSAEYFNQQYFNYVGLSLGEKRDWDWTAAMSEYWDLTTAVHPDELPALTTTWDAILASGQPGESEARLRRYDGKYRWFLFRANPLLDDSGNVIRWYGTCTDFDDQKRAEEALRDSERNFRLTIDTIPALAWAARPDGSVEFVNQHYLDYLGLDAGQAQGWGWTSAVHPDDRDALVATWRAILASGDQGEAETRLKRSDGEFRWFLFRVSPLRNASGRIASWYGVNTDIDDRKRAETDLAREKQLLEMIVSGTPLRQVLGDLCEMVEETAPDCYCAVRAVDWNGPGIEYSVAPSLPGISADPTVHGLSSVWTTSILAKDGRVLGTFCVYQRNPAEPSPRRQSLIAHATHIASIAMERARTEAALRRSETLLAEGQRLSATGTFSWRVDTDEITFSEELHHIFEFDLNATVTLEQLRARVHPEDLSLVSEQLDRVRNGHDYSGYEIRLLMPDRRVKYLRTFGRVICHHDDRLECLAAVQDITEHRLADEALGKARSELVHVARITSLGALTASIAHEVNQPLSGIITNAGTCLRMLAADPPNMDGARETARRTIRDGNRAADVITRLRALFSKRTATQPVDLNEAARGVIELLWSELQRSRVVLRTALADGLPLVSGDRVQLQQVIMNLLRNAADAMGDVDRPRRLLVSTELDEDDQIRLTVQDAGVGLGREDIGRLFDAFYTTKSDGMGIGLFVSRSIIENHNGRLWAAPGDGAGATFSFSIPRYSVEQAPAQVISAARASSSAVPNGRAEIL